jgi:hypothetical protein
VISVSLFEIIPLAVSILTGLGSLVVAWFVFGGRREEARRAKDRHLAKRDARQAKFYKDRLESWRANGDLIMNDETWDSLMAAGEKHPQVYAQIYRAIKPHVRQPRKIRAGEARRQPVTLSANEGKRGAGSRELEEPGFRVNAPVPL